MAGQTMSDIVDNWLRYALNAAIPSLRRSMITPFLEKHAKSDLIAPFEDSKRSSNECQRHGCEK